MEIREGTQRIENGTKQAIIEFVFTDYIIFVFQGTLSQFDIGQPIKFCVNNNPSFIPVCGMLCMPKRE